MVYDHYCPYIIMNIFFYKKRKKKKTTDLKILCFPSFYL